MPDSLRQAEIHRRIFQSESLPSIAVTHWSAAFGISTSLFGTRVHSRRNTSLPPRLLIALGPADIGPESLRKNWRLPGSALCVPRLREGRLFETAALRFPQSLPRRRPGMRTFLNPINGIPCENHAEERLKGASRRTHIVDAAGFGNSFIDPRSVLARRAGTPLAGSRLPLIRRLLFPQPGLARNAASRS
jgi:hypothetical protein